MNNLRGSLCISRLENVSNGNEAKEAFLSDKQYLDKLELKWSELSDDKIEEENILESLQPHINLKELQITSFGGGKFPSWIEDTPFPKLETLSLYNFRNCQILPCTGQLVYLKSMYIGEMHSVKRIDHQFIGNGMGWTIFGFPSLENLVFDGMPNLEEWVEVRGSHFPYLRQLTIAYCPKLVSLPMLAYLKSLKHLEICWCPKLPSLPEGGLPTSLESLIIKDSPTIKERCNKEDGEDWCKIAQVPSVWIDNQEISIT